MPLKFSLPDKTQKIVISNFMGKKRQKKKKQQRAGQRLGSEYLVSLLEKLLNYQIVAVVELFQL